MRVVCLVCGQESGKFGCALNFTTSEAGIVMTNWCKNPDIKIAVGVLPTAMQEGADETTDVTEG